MGCLFATFEQEKNDYTYKIVITLINLSKTARERDLVTGDCFLVEFFLFDFSICTTFYKMLLNENGVEQKG